MPAVQTRQPTILGSTGGGTPTPSAGWTGTAVRVLFGVIFGIDAALKWLPGYRATYLSQLKSVAHGQPSWLHGWFGFWVHLQSAAPGAFATLTGITETGLAARLLLGLGRRAGYLAGAAYTLLIWAVGEGFGGPYTPGSTDVGTGIVYALLFITLLAFAPPARRERLSLDRVWSRAGRGGGSPPSRTPSTAPAGRRWLSPSPSASTSRGCAPAVSLASARPNSSAAGSLP